MAVAPSWETQIIEQAPYAGLRVSVEEYLELPEDGNRYQLINGVILRSPRAMPLHQAVAMEIGWQLESYLRRKPIGKIFPEIDVVFDASPKSGLIYVPDLIFVPKKRLPRKNKAMVGPPDLAVEVISPGSRRLDTKTKREDYERYGVMEYWLIDPDQKRVTFFRLKNNKYLEIAPDADTYKSEAVPGFVLDLKSLRVAMKGW
jgi:Uma2 family endonuclease